MKLIDTNIIMYAVGRDHAFKKPCRDILQKITYGEIEANIDVETLQELLYVYSSRGEKKKGLDVVEDILILFPHPLAIRKTEIEKAKDLMRKHAALTPRDAVHCAVAITCNLEGIISTDKDLDMVKEIHRYKP